MHYRIGARVIDSIDFWQEATYYGIQFPLYHSVTEIPPNEVREMKQSEIGMMDMET